MQSIMNGTASEELIRELGRHSPTMQRLNNDFRHVCQDLDVLAIYEKKPTATLRVSEAGRLERTGPLEMMVERDSALLYLEKEIPIGLEQDHSRIAKVDRGQNGCYDEIIHFIQQSISSASTRREPQQSYYSCSSVTLDGRDVIHQEPSGQWINVSAHSYRKLPAHNSYVLVKNADLSCPALPKRRKPLFLVPFGRDDSFIDRIEVFNDINEHSKQHRRVALSGIGGIGSVTLTIYCRRL